jgi:ubiquinone/menaquinone biosynthesis C-methylase UbiE
MRQREKVIPLAYGEVLEIGIGSGLNMPYYDASQVRHVTGIDPSSENWNMNEHDAQGFDFEFEFIQAAASNIPFDNNQFDSAVFTYTLCSINFLRTWSGP